MKKISLILLSLLLSISPALASPATGDYSHMTLWITLFAVAIVILLVILAITIHRNSKHK